MKKYLNDYFVTLNRVCLDYCQSYLDKIHTVTFISLVVTFSPYIQFHLFSQMDRQTYTFNEGQINLPTNWKDQSINMFVVPDENPINFVINRVLVPFGVSNEEYYAQILDQFRRELKDYQELSYEVLSLNDIPSYLLEYQWQTPEGKMTQLTLLHITNGKLLTFTFSSRLGFTANQKQYLQQIIFTFKSTSLSI